MLIRIEGIGAPGVGNEANVGGLQLVKTSSDPVPEPGTFVLFGAAALGAYVVRRRRKAS